MAVRVESDFYIPRLRTQKPIREAERRARDEYRSLGREILDEIAKKHGTTGDVVRGRNGIPAWDKRKIQDEFIMTVNELRLPLSLKDQADILGRQRWSVIERNKRLGIKTF